MYDNYTHAMPSLGHLAANTIEKIVEQGEVLGLKKESSIDGVINAVEEMITP